MQYSYLTKWPRVEVFSKYKSIMHLKNDKAKRLPAFMKEMAHPFTSMRNHIMQLNDKNRMSCLVLIYCNNLLLHLQLCDALIKDEHTEPKYEIYKDRVQFVGSTKEQNVSVLLWNITFEDGGVYTCYGKNPKEKGRNHNATFTLVVVDECKSQEKRYISYRYCIHH